MLTPTAWDSDTQHSADEALGRVETLKRRCCSSCSTPRWSAGRPGRKSRRPASCTTSPGAGAVSGGFWGMLFGLLFLTPLLGMAVGAASSGVLLGSKRDVGISDDFNREVRSDARA
jgi:uncharacterized membrane protein